MADMVEILKAGTKLGASDVIIVPGEPPLVRVSGIVRKLEGAALTPDDTEGMIYSLLSDEQKARFEDQLELDCSFALSGISRFRVNVLMQSKGVASVLRVITDRIPTPQEIGLTPSIINLTHLPRGLVLVTGPT